ncbi:MAG TPA: ParB/RepB/Spo0J family partition protein [Pseudonocardiaceae bacterium]|nr:ParB/RepB/Spo0J family partition protein [Pseudonocardiaceae bacterium]
MPDVIHADTVELVPIESLVPSESPRALGENDDHVRALAEADAALPPILVHRPTMRVVDGRHRLRAAHLRGRDRIEVRFVDGDDTDLFVLAVRENVDHGLPLSLAERKAAAARILLTHGHWSDRAIGAVTGLTHKTISSIRRRSGGDSVRSEVRIGRDGVARPLDPGPGRRVAENIIRNRPDAPLREIAKEAGIALSTAHDVRRRMTPAQPDVPEQRSIGRPDDKRSPALRALARDPSLRGTEAGRILLRWLAGSVIGQRECALLIDAVPGHCAAAVAELARNNAARWQQFAADLQRRAKIR